MNDFALSPFLIGLESSGIHLSLDDYQRLTQILKLPGHWNREQLRGVLMALLIHNSDQEEIFRRKFDDFFPKNLSIPDIFTNEQLREILEAIQTTDWKKIDESQPKDKTFKQDSTEHSKRDSKIENAVSTSGANETKSTIKWNEVWRYIWIEAARLATLILFFFIIMVAIIVNLFSDQASDNTNTNGQIVTSAAAPATQANNENSVNNVNNANNNPVVNGTKPETGSSSNRIIVIISGIAGALIATIFSMLKIRVRLQVEKGKTQAFDSQKSQFFPLNKIGGNPAPYLDNKTLDDLARSLNYFLSENPAKQLNIKESVYDSVKNNGTIKLHFHRLKLVRRIYIMEDTYAEPVAWNPIARELAAGLSRRGIDVRFGKFYGSPANLQMDNGGSDLLKEIEEHWDKSLFFFFSDGKNLNQYSDRFLFETLARRSAAWFDLRERDYWDESAEIIKYFKIPLFQANREGIIKAVKRFYTEYGAKDDDGHDIAIWFGVKSTARKSLEKYIAESLGPEAVGWAQACAMIQPLSLGMADALRRRFSPQLRPEQIERLCRIPGSKLNASGIHFTLQTLAVLRRGFTESRGIDRQEEILNFILKQIEAVKPPEKDSLQYLTWEWTYERVRLEIEPDPALESITRLARTPLKDHIKTDLLRVYLPGEAPVKTEEDKTPVFIPLRVRPKTEYALLQFRALTGRPFDLKKLSFSEIFNILTRPKRLESITIKFRDDSNGKPPIQTSQKIKSGLELRNITKTFGNVVANNDVCIKIEKGTIHALVGENGAGKSTVMRIAYGFETADSGEILVDGNRVYVSNPHNTIALGIGMVHQHFMLVETMTVAENIILSAENDSSLSLDLERVGKDIARISQDLRLSLNADALIEDLSVGEQQRVELLKALYRSADLLILDEPTAVLTPPEVEDFFNILRRLREQGKTIIISTHKLEEVLAISDDVTVMRDGRVIGTIKTEDTNTQELARMIVGRDVLLRVEKPDANPGEKVLSIRNLFVPGKHGGKLIDTSFDVRAGEIVGIAGIEGNGQSELIEAIAGLSPVQNRLLGQIIYDGRDIIRWTVKMRRAAGMAHIPEDRHRRGLLLDFDLTENIILGAQYRSLTSLLGFLKTLSIGQYVKDLLDYFDVRPRNPEISVRSLSGGNQQKLIVGREFSLAPKLLLVSQPTRGVDIGAIEFIHRKLIELRDKGAAILLVSSELDEVMALADKLLVINKGEIVRTVDPKKVSTEEIGILMTTGRGTPPK